MVKRAKAWHPRRRVRAWLARQIWLLIWPRLEPELTERGLWRTVLTGPRDRIHIAPTASLANTVVNAASGHITVGDHAFFGYGATLAAGSHDYRQFGQARIDGIPETGYDIVIEEGVWGASNVTVVGPCRVGAHAVLAAGAVVTGDVEPYAIMAGVPARKIGDVRD